MSFALVEIVRCSPLAELHITRHKLTGAVIVRLWGRLNPLKDKMTPGPIRVELTSEKAAALAAALLKVADT
jgi:hypothetical protein